MFNHYSVRPVGSVRFERHLAEMMRIGNEKYDEEKSNIPVLPVVLQKDPTDKLSGYDPVEQGWKELEFAILAQAVADYLDEYEDRLFWEDRGNDQKAYVHECRCLTLENEYFRMDEDRGNVLDLILKYVIHNPYDRGKFKWRMDRIRNAKKRFTHLIG